MRHVSLLTVYIVHWLPVQVVTVVRWLLVAALAYVFLFFGIDKLIRPLLWIGWIPPVLEEIFGLTRNQWLSVVGVVESILGLLLLIPKMKLQRIVVALMALHLLAVLTQTGVFTDIGVRDTGLLLASVALFFLL